jgi:hypothetical protein
MSADRRQRLIGHVAHREYPALDPPVTSFGVTVRDVVDTADGERPEVVRLWARTTWDAWAAHHERVRLWLSDAIRSTQ